MTTNSLQDNLAALQHLVAFAEGDTRIFPNLLLKAGADGLVAASTITLKQVAALTPRQVDLLQAELRAFLRGVAAGAARMIAPMHVTVSVVTHPAMTPTGRRARRGARAASLLIEGGPRDFLFDETNRLLSAVALEALKVCPGCGKAFVKVTRKRFCSTRCQSRIYMRQWRTAERAEQEQFIHEHKATRTRRR